MLLKDFHCVLQNSHEALGNQRAVCRHTWVHHKQRKWHSMKPNCVDLHTWPYEIHSFFGGLDQSVSGQCPFWLVHSILRYAWCRDCSISIRYQKETTSQWHWKEKRAKPPSEKPTGLYHRPTGSEPHARGLTLKVSDYRKQHVSGWNLVGACRNSSSCLSAPTASRWALYCLATSYFDCASLGVFTDMMNYSHWKFNRKTSRSQTRNSVKSPAPCPRLKGSPEFHLKVQTDIASSVARWSKETKGVAPNCLAPPPEGYIPWVALRPENCSHTYGSHATTGLLLGKDTKFLGWFG